MKEIQTLTGISINYGPEAKTIHEALEKAFTPGSAMDLEFKTTKFECENTTGIIRYSDPGINSQLHMAPTSVGYAGMSVLVVKGYLTADFNLPGGAAHYDGHEVKDDETRAIIGPTSGDISVFPRGTFVEMTYVSGARNGEITFVRSADMELEMASMSGDRPELNKPDYSPVPLKAR